VEYTVADQLLINTIYNSIQGESSWAGLPCTFIRFTGCHLRCTYCDSEYAFHRGTRMTLDEVVASAAELSTPQVLLTGGEPLLQLACGPLAHKLLAGGHTVLCETSGTLPIDRLPRDVIKIMDLKTPSSGESQRTDWSNIQQLKPCDEVKFVIGDREDFDWSAAMIDKHDLANHCRLLMSPAFGRIEPRLMAEWILAERLPVRLQLQLHKYIWEHDAVGV